MAAAPSLTEIQHRAAVDTAFRSALRSDPRAALAAEGIEVPDGVTIEVYEAGYNVLPLVLPPVERGELSDEALGALVGGAQSTASFVSGFLTGS